MGNRRTRRAVVHKNPSCERQQVKLRGRQPGHQQSKYQSERRGTAVTIDDFAFSPATVNVKAGQQVTWTNKQQGVAHTVTADGGAFDHPMPSGATFTFTFAKAGAFAYHCSIHPSMHGTVTAS